MQSLEVSFLSTESTETDGAGIWQQGVGDWKILSTAVHLGLQVSMWLGYSECDSEISSSISSIVESVGD